MKLDIGCGQAKAEGFTGIDIADLPEVDIRHDIFSFPWPIPDGSVTEARCSHFFEHVPAKLRPAFMNELWRVLAPDAMVLFITPLGLERQCQDLSHEWPPIVSTSYLYFSRKWLRSVGIGHYIDLHGIRCNFDTVDVKATVDETHANLDDADRQRAVKYLTNAGVDLIVTLRKLPLDA